MKLTINCMPLSTWPLLAILLTPTMCLAGGSKFECTIKSYTISAGGFAPSDLLTGDVRAWAIGDPNPDAIAAGYLGSHFVVDRSSGRYSGPEFLETQVGTTTKVVNNGTEQGYNYLALEFQHDIMQRETVHSMRMLSVANSDEHNGRYPFTIAYSTLGLFLAGVCVDAA